MNSIRLQLFISKSGICSRRKAEDLIKQGKIKVNGQKILEPYFKVSPLKDKVALDGKRIRLKDKVYLIFHKPAGVTTTKEDPHAEKTVMDFFPRDLQHLHPVGRLDKNTSGLLLLTNHGEFTLKFTHPRYSIKKVYIVDLNKPLERGHMLSLSRGVFIEDYKTAPCKITILAQRKVKITISEGKKRQIRKMFKEKGYRVYKLKRIKESFFSLGDLPPGEYRYLSLYEKKKLKKLLKSKAKDKR